MEKLRNTFLVMLIAFAAITAHTAELKEPKTSIPQIAEIAGIQVGSSSMEELEARFGKGKGVTGGHPNGARLWRVKGTSWMIHADAFDYSTKGAVVDAFSITGYDKSQKEVPYARFAKNKLAYLGGITLGMGEDELLRIAKRNSLTAIKAPDGWLIKATGYSPLTSIPSALEEWTAQFVIKKKSITGILLGASEKSAAK